MCIINVKGFVFYINFVYLLACSYEFESFHNKVARSEKKFVNASISSFENIECVKINNDNYKYDPSTISEGRSNFVYEFLL